jgi:hypothetical protein
MLINHSLKFKGNITVKKHLKLFIVLTVINAQYILY